MADALSMNISEGAEHLVCVEFNEKNWDWLLHAVVVLHYSVDGLRNEVHHHVKIELLFLTNKFRVYLIAFREERMSHFDDRGMVQLLHYLELSVLIALILEHFLNCDDFSCLCVRCLQNSNSAIFSLKEPLYFPRESPLAHKKNSLPNRRLQMSHCL